MPFWSESADGLEIRVRVTPKGGRDAIDGTAALSDGREVLKVRVRVAPEDGAANAAVTKLLAAAAGIAASQVTLAAGATARVKTFRLKGDMAALRKALEDAAS
ncbi:DUF167 family protein [Aquabacter cavernae]|uniref:DUF167 family protein n=1 Tax=Aquabacter cavernae TaxID=2496029 RepID=UPI000F8EA7DC|nr:DUF167 family protein [Aquabacter cavernae]